MYGLQKFTALFVVAAFWLGISVAADVDCSKHPEHIDPKECCKMPDFIPDDIKEKCKISTMPPPPQPISEGEDSDESTSRPHPHPHPRPHPHPPHHNPCFMECVLNETGIVKDNEVDHAKLEEHLNKIGAGDMISVIKNSFDFCAAKGEEFRAKWEEKKKNNPRPTPADDKMIRPHCNHGSGFLMGCAMMESFKNCTPSKWNDNEQCNDKRNFLINCKPKGGPRGHKGKGPSDSVESDV